MAVWPFLGGVLFFSYVSPLFFFILLHISHFTCENPLDRQTRVDKVKVTASFPLIGIGLVTVAHPMEADGRKTIQQGER